MRYKLDLLGYTQVVQRYAKDGTPMVQARTTGNPIMVPVWRKRIVENNKYSPLYEQKENIHSGADERTPGV